MILNWHRRHTGDVDLRQATRSRSLNTIVKVTDTQRRDRQRRAYDTRLQDCDTRERQRPISDVAARHVTGSDSRRHDNRIRSLLLKRGSTSDRRKLVEQNWIPIRWQQRAHNSLTYMHMHCILHYTCTVVYNQQYSQRTPCRHLHDHAITTITIVQWQWTCCGEQMIYRLSGTISMSLNHLMNRISLLGLCINTVIKFL